MFQQPLRRLRLRQETSAWAFGGPVVGRSVVICLRRWRESPQRSPLCRVEQPHRRCALVICHICIGIFIFFLRRCSWVDATYPIQDKKTIPEPAPGPPHLKRETQRPGLPHRARGVLWNPAGSCLGSNGIDWRKNGVAQWLELTNLNKTKNLSPRRYPALLTSNGKHSARACHTGQEGSCGTLLVLVWAPTGSIGARTGRAVAGTSESQ
jgi:hypothetical protein